MGTIINLYLFPKGPLADRPSAADVGAALLEEGYLRLPLMVGPPVKSRHQAVVFPQAAVGGWAAKDFQDAAQSFEDLDAALAALRRPTDQAVIYAFNRLNESHPSVRRDFDMYFGRECAVGAYVVPDGRRLHFTSEYELEPDGSDKTRRDSIETDWIHFQGKVAPWTQPYLDSELAALVERLWPGHEVFEDCWA